MRIENIATARFNRMLRWLDAQGWRRVYQYEGFDVGIDYNEIHFSKAGVGIKCVWDNWTEGEISAPAEIEGLRAVE